MQSLPLTLFASAAMVTAFTAGASFALPSREPAVVRSSLPDVQAAIRRGGAAYRGRSGFYRGGAVVAGRRGAYGARYYGRRGLVYGGRAGQVRRGVYVAGGPYYR